jgi:probable DNA metabolism protein
LIRVHIEPSFESFRESCRDLLAAEISPRDVEWSDPYDAQDSLLPSETVPAAPSHTFRVPRRYVELARTVYAHRDPARWSLLYSVLWRILHGEHNLLSVQIDPEVLRLNEMRQAIARDVHHVHAFVRFRTMERDGEEWYVGWYNPDHHVLRLAAPFFVERFAAMRWAILTPDESAYWDGRRLEYAAGVPSSQVPDNDALEQLWSAYYRTTFNPARMNLDLMRQEMPSRFWSQMPELRDLSGVLAEAPERLETMRKQQAASALSVVPESRDLRVLREAASTCTACLLHCEATQTIFGEGPAAARVVLVGEQPGDVEDLEGRPFVGPAGEVLARALAEAGVSREDVYTTNAVKHFKFVREGKRRLHQTPRMAEVVACKPWLEAEIAAIRPQAIVLLGSTAAKSLLGSTVRITRDAGTILRSRYAEHTVISVHPSFVLRSQDKAQSREVFERLVADLATVRPFVSGRLPQPA